MSPSLWTALAAVSTAYAASDNSQVFALPVKDVSLSNGKLMRGVPISAGTPSQSFAVVPQAHFDDTILYTKSSGACASNATSATCVTLCGGLYDQQTSSSSSTIDQDPGNDSIVGDDLLIGNSSLSDYPIVLPITEWGPTGNTLGSLGVSPNSTLLNALLTAGKIASRSYSWWWGVQTSTNLAATDGQLVLGGFDAAKMQGSQYSFPLVAPTRTALLACLQACIMPDAPLIAYIPQTPYFKTFQALTGTSNVGTELQPATLNYQGMLFPQSNVYKGNLTISINNEIAFEFPNDQLVLPNANVQPDGSILADQAAPELLLGSVLGPSSGWAVLGRSFFQAAYLAVNYDAGNFTISLWAREERLA
ncbi:aspartic peptidase domain-containing protein [Neohortaea acidophila]|uniref:Aspartic peptidase domain-containing protein n=1 Tax=Neohortaea acidophila TaxID=245834 RepID=A0A6A6PYA8_9PEZI|nr:aspartic peptidase domain-containing protein [Neohortaea acidophila]KAF2485188.1 aspartic peptidase domain-containing protein [Neohortaea acidophila]